MIEYFSAHGIYLADGKKQYHDGLAVDCRLCKLFNFVAPDLATFYDMVRIIDGIVAPEGEC